MNLVHFTQSRQVLLKSMYLVHPVDVVQAVLGGQTGV